MDSFLKMAAGAFLLTLTAYFGHTLYMQYRFDKAVTQFSSEVSKLGAEAQEQLQKQNYLARKQKEETRRKANLEKKKSEAKRRRIAKEQAIERQKLAAWKTWYVKPEECQKLNLGDMIVECGNHRIRARNEFDRLWLNGDLAYSMAN